MVPIACATSFPSASLRTSRSPLRPGDHLVMPQKSKGKGKPLSTATRGAPAQRVDQVGTTSAPGSAMLATPAYAPPNAGPPSFPASRPTLPPLLHLQTQSASHIASLPYHSAPHGPTSAHVGPVSQLALPPLSTDPSRYSGISLRPGGPEYHATNVSSESEFSPASIGRSHNPLKRGPDYTDFHAERFSPHAAPPFASQIDPNDLRTLPCSRSVSTTSTPTTASYPTFGQPVFSSRHSATSSNPMSSRCSLHIRQQPRAARAGPDGKDRRPIDPPPVLQLLLTDFDADSPGDVDELQNSYYVVHCRLVSANSPRRDVSTLASTTDDGSKEIQRLLLGTAVASPHHTKDDPDPDTMPEHPVSEVASGPPSPSSRFIPVSSKGKHRAPALMPCTFFIFADVSVRKAGEYRLEFNLMKVEAATLVPGASMPILHSVATQVFRVVNAKDFDQVQPSSRLVRGLIERGAGFPLKLKKGTREGQRRRPGGGSDKMDTGSNDDGSDEEEEDDGE